MWIFEGQCHALRQIARQRKIISASGKGMRVLSKTFSVASMTMSCQVEKELHLTDDTYANQLSMAGS